jgi:hypothetical protein
MVAMRLDQVHLTTRAKAKVKRVVETVNHEFSKRKSFSAADVNRHLDIDRHRYIRLLGRLGFLRKEEGAEKTANYIRTDSWRPRVEFLKGTPIGIAYYLPIVFRIGSNSAVKIRAHLKPARFHSRPVHHRRR